MTPVLTFDPELHAYSVAGVRVPSVTQILAERGMYDTRWFTEASRKRGTDVHTAIHLLAEDDLDWSTVDPQIEPYVRAYERFVNETRLERFAWELALYHPEKRYAGTLDLLAWMHDEPNLTLFDFKTGPYSVIHDVQIALYRELMKVNCVQHGLTLAEAVNISPQVVELRSDGTYKLPKMILRNVDAMLYGLQLVSLTHLFEFKGK